MSNSEKTFWKLLGAGVMLGLIVLFAAGFFNMNKDLDHYINEMVSQPAKVYNVPSEQLRADVKDRVSNETYDKICDAILNNLTVTYLLNGNLHVVFITPVPAGAYPEYPTLVYKYGASGYEYDSLIVTHFEEGPQFSE